MEEGDQESLFQAVMALSVEMQPERNLGIFVLGGREISAWMTLRERVHRSSCIDGLLISVLDHHAHAVRPTIHLILYLSPPVPTIEDTSHPRN